MLKVATQSKLEVVEATLAKRPDIVVVSKEIRTTDIRSLSNEVWAEMVNFKVAPLQSTFDAEKLQALMMGLVPEGLTLSDKDNFSMHAYGPEGILKFGTLYFDEDIGSVKGRVDITVEDQQFLKRLRASNPSVKSPEITLETDSQLRRSTWVSLYPDVQSAEDKDTEHFMEVKVGLLGRVHRE